MAKKPTITTISSGYASTTSLNSNFEELRDAFDNTLSLDGSTPNAMQADLDMDSNDILNAGRILVGGTDYLAQALAARNAAIVAQNAAETAETNAETAETNAEASETAAQASETAAGTSATNAASSASSAASSASTATTQAGVATTKASEASASASAAATSESNAAISAINAATSESNAAGSASAAASSASSAQASKDAALAALDNFDDRYLGQKASDPTVDNDGDPLLAGSLYFNTTDDVMKVYEGSVWVAAYASLSGALLAANNLSDLNSVSAALTNLGAATAAQGTLADSAVQPDDNVTLGTVTADGLTVDTDTLYVDATGNKVGIGTSSPDNKLEVEGSGAITRLTGSGGDFHGMQVKCSDASGSSTKNVFVEALNESDAPVASALLAVESDGGSSWQFTTQSAGTRTDRRQERMRIDSSGNVGIGTTSPEATLTVEGQTILGSTVAGSANLTNLTSGTPPQLIAGWSVPAITWTPSASTEAVFTRDGHMQIDILAGANSFSKINFSDPDDEDVGQVSYAHSTDSMIFRTNNAERMRIDSSGNVGIGKTNPATALDVNGTVTATSYVGDGSSLTGIAAGATGGGSDEIFWENGQNVTTNYTITNGKNAMSAGPITVDSGVTVTVGAGETWTVV